MCLAGCGAASSGRTATRSAAPALFVQGSLTLTVDADTDFADRPGCTGGDGYDDVHEGTTVTIRGADGKIIGAGSLGPGVEQAAGTGMRGECRFTFSIGKVPVEKFYTVEVSHRGQTTFTEQQVRSDAVHLTLGT